MASAPRTVLQSLIRVRLGTLSRESPNPRQFPAFPVEDELKPGSSQNDTRAPGFAVHAVTAYPDRDPASPDGRAGTVRAVIPDRSATRRRRAAEFCMFRYDFCRFRQGGPMQMPPTSTAARRSGLASTRPALVAPMPDRCVRATANILSRQILTGNDRAVIL